MAVNLTVAQLRNAVRVDDSTSETERLTAMLETATAMVNNYAPESDVPAAIGNEAVIRIVGYLYDSPQASRNSAYANAMRNSGASTLLAPYKARRAGIST